MQLPTRLAQNMRSVTFSQLIKILRNHDSRFVTSVCHEVANKNYAEKSELSHRMLIHPDIGGKRRHIPVRYDGDDGLIPTRTLNAVVRRFDLPSSIFDLSAND